MTSGEGAAARARRDRAWPGGRVRRRRRGRGGPGAWRSVVLIARPCAPAAALSCCTPPPGRVKGHVSVDGQCLPRPPPTSTPRAPADPLQRARERLESRFGARREDRGLPSMPTRVPRSRPPQRFANRPRRGCKGPHSPMCRPWGADAWRWGWGVDGGRAGAAALAAAMGAIRSPRIVALGEDLGRGGIFGQYKGLIAEFGADRVIDTPISDQPPSSAPALAWRSPA